MLILTFADLVLSGEAASNKIVKAILYGYNLTIIPIFAVIGLGCIAR